ncbi:DUF4097 family beta strand repeat-containing protein [Streptomyces sp. NPDC005435]|uniref:DUF4097 family beta strand repeat-containing protein n=1 Tax=Streptomyces sp. NPDC005435 TaxID=3154464 RepID=UPI0034569AF3
MHAQHTGTRPGRLLLIAGSAVLAAAALTSCDGHTKVAESRYGIDAKVTSLDTSTSGGNIEVVAGKGPGARVTERLTYSGDKPRTAHTLHDGTLSLSAPGCAGGRSGNCGVDYRVTVPRGTTLSVRTEGGNITLRGLSGAVAARTEGGNIRVSGSTAKRLAAYTSGGGVDLALTTTPDKVTAESKGGNVTVRLPQGRYALDVSTGGGRRTVSVGDDPSSSHMVRAHTSGGDVSVRATG